MKNIKDYISWQKQVFHQPIMQKQTRFYFIQVYDIQIHSKQFKPPLESQQFKSKSQNNSKTQKNSNKKTENNKNKTFPSQIWQSKVTFQIGRRQSSSDFKLTKKQADQFFQSKTKNNKNQQYNKGFKLSEQQNSHAKQQQNNKQAEVEQQNSNTKQLEITKKAGDKQQSNKSLKKVKQLFTDMHIFPFQKQEVMTVKLQIVSSQKQILKQSGQKEYKKQYGYALIPLVPFIKMPYTQHQIQIDLVQQNDKKQINKNVVATLKINLYFMHNFKARLFIQIVKCDLERNIAQIGQMSPIIRLFLRDKSFYTQAIDEGGIKPYWKSQKKEQYCYFNIPLESVFDDLYIYLFYNRQVTMDETIGKYRIDLQQQQMFKKGCQVQQFIKNSITKNKQKSKQNRQKQRQQKERKQEQNKKQIKAQVKNRIYQIETMVYKYINEILQQRANNLQIRVNQYRQQIINKYIKQSKELNSKNRQQLMDNFINKIYNQYNKQQPNKQLIKKQQFMLKISDCPQNQLLHYQFIIYSKIQKDIQNQIKKQIEKLLFKQMEYLTSQSIKRKMQSKTINLQYLSYNTTNQIENQQTAGKLQFNYSFFYQFDIDNYDDNQS